MTYFHRFSRTIHGVLANFRDVQLIQIVTHKLEEVSPTPSWQDGADSGQMSTYINILRHFMLFYASNRDDDKKSLYFFSWLFWTFGS